MFILLWVVTQLLLSTKTKKAQTKSLKWQAVLDDFGDWDNPDSLQDDKMIDEARKSVEHFKLEAVREAEQMRVYGEQLLLNLERARLIQQNESLSAGMKWKALSEMPKLPQKAPGEQGLEFSQLEESYEKVSQELSNAAKLETPDEPHTLDSIFANSSFANLSSDLRKGLILAAQEALIAKGNLVMEKPDGQPGEATHRSIADFQLSNGMVANGELNDATLWMLGFEGFPVSSALAASSKSGSKSASKATKKRIPARPAKSIYEGPIGAARLAKDKLFKRVNQTEYSKHLRYKAWQEKYGDL